MSYDSQHRFLVETPEETVALGQIIGRYARPGSLIGLSGPLGAGKTELSRGIALGLGITEDITSPTFVMEVIYDVPSGKVDSPVKKLHHWDLYRITGGLFDSEIAEYSGDCCRIVVIEWPERVPSLNSLLTVKVLLDFPSFDTSQQSGKEPLTVEAILDSVRSSKRIIEVVERENSALCEALEGLTQLTITGTDV